LDHEVVEAVIVAKEGRVGVCIDICLEMSGGIETPPKRTKSDEVQSDEADLLGLEGEHGFGDMSIEDKGPRKERHGEQINLME
jgi:hypothetical protein